MIRRLWNRLFPDSQKLVAGLVRDNERLRDELAVCRAVLRSVATQAENALIRGKSK